MQNYQCIQHEDKHMQRERVVYPSSKQNLTVLVARSHGYPTAHGPRPTAGGALSRINEKTVS